MEQRSHRYTYIRYAYLAALTVVAVASVLPITLPIRLWVLCAITVLIGGALWRTRAPESATPPPAPRLSRRAYGLIFITIIALSALASYGLDRQYLWTDDVISFMAAERLLLTGSTTFETGLPYPGAALYHHLLAGSLWLFGSDVFGSRIINIGFLALILSLAAYTLRRYGLPTILIGITFLATTPIILAMVRDTRWYTFLALLILATIALTHAAHEQFIQARYRRAALGFALAALMAYLSYRTHATTVVYLLGIASFFILAAFSIHRTRAGCALAGLALLLVFAAVFIKTSQFSLLTALFETFVIDWAADQTRRPYWYVALFHTYIGYATLGATMVGVALIGTRDRWLILLSTVSVVALLVLSYQRAVETRYAYAVVPLLALAITIASYYHYQLFRPFPIARFWWRDHPRLVFYWCRECEA